MLLSVLDLTPSGRPRLWQGEVEQAFLDKADLQFETEGGVPGCVAKRHEDGFAVLTTHRLIWVDAAKAPAPGASCYAHLACCESVELSATKRWSQTKLRVRVHLDQQGRPASGAGGVTRVEEFRLVARSYGAFAEAARRALHARAWEARPAGQAQQQQQQQGGPVDAALLEQLAGMGFSRPRAAKACQETRNAGPEAALQWLLDHESDPEPGSALAQQLGQRQSGPGIVGILRREQEVAAHNDRTLEEAFVDLRGLMAKAAEMVQLAEKFRGTLAVRGGGGGEAGGGEEALPADMQQQLIEMGIASPVTREAAGARYHMELSRQLADFLTPRLAAGGGLLTLADAYCLFNRARGTELVSPDDLLQAARLFPTVGAPMHLRTFASGLLVVQSNSHDDDEVCGRIAELVAGDGLGRPLTAAEVASALAVPLTVASQHLATAEARELLCRDDGPSGLRFYRNFFEEAAAAAACVQ